MSYITSSRKLLSSSSMVLQASQYHGTRMVRLAIGRSLTQLGSTPRNSNLTFPLLIPQPCRQYSQTIALSSPILVADSNSQDQQSITLFIRGEDSNHLTRSAFAFSSVNSLCWIWYNFDFAPTVNASPIADLHINPIVPAFGLSLAVCLQIMMTLYPKRLIHEIKYNPELKTVDIYTLKLPWVTPITHKPTFTVPILDLKFTMFNDNVPKFVNLLQQYQQQQRHNNSMTESSMSSNSTTSSSFWAKSKSQRWFLSWTDAWWPAYMLEIRKPTDVPNPDLFLQVLLFPEQIYQLGNSNVNGNNDSRAAYGKSKKRSFISSRRRKK